VRLKRKDALCVLSPSSFRGDAPRPFLVLAGRDLALSPWHTETSRHGMRALADEARVRSVIKTTDC
jgi:hypothetical protein